MFCRRGGQTWSQSSTTVDVDVVLFPVLVVFAVVLVSLPLRVVLFWWW